MAMDKANRTEVQRLFLLDSLPEPLTRASSHIQIFDNYIAQTRLRLRSVRNPERRKWTHILQQRFPASEGDLSCIKVAEIFLNAAEYQHFKIFEGAEIRKNRYFHEFDGRMMAFDLFLGKLWGLNMAKVEFESIEEAKMWEVPSFAVFEVTGDPFFAGESLSRKGFEDIQAEVSLLEPHFVAPQSDFAG